MSELSCTTDLILGSASTTSLHLYERSVMVGEMRAPSNVPAQRAHGRGGHSQSEHGNLSSETFLFYHPANHRRPILGRVASCARRIYTPFRLRARARTRICVKESPAAMQRLSFRATSSASIWVLLRRRATSACLTGGALQAMTMPLARTLTPAEYAFAHRVGMQDIRGETLRAALAHPALARSRERAPSELEEHTRLQHTGMLVGFRKRLSSQARK